MDRRQFIKTSGIVTAQISVLSDNNAAAQPQTKNPDSSEQDVNCPRVEAERFYSVGKNNFLDKKLWYESPAENFNEALPLGNGRLGDMIYGGVNDDRIALNEDTIWAGGEAPKPSPEAFMALPKVRQLLFDGKYQDAQRMIEEKMLTDFNQPYLPAGDLLINQPEREQVRQYRRELDLNTAISTVKFKTGLNNKQVRQFFCSAVDDVFAINIHCNQIITELNFSLTSMLRHYVEFVKDGLELNAQTPINVTWTEIDRSVTLQDAVEYAQTPPCRFTIACRIIANGAEIVQNKSQIKVVRAKDVTLLLAISTTRKTDNPALECSRRLDLAAAKGFEKLKYEHINEYQRLFKRVELNLGITEQKTKMLSTEKRIMRYSAKQPDLELESLLFDYGRYLLISSSREGCEPANLQGIWNESMQPPWWSNYTININTEMNYWLAEVCNLSECHGPLFDFIEQLRVSGEQTARIHYGCGGWVAHHQSDYLRQTTPVGKLNGRVNYGAAQYAMWPMAGAWLCSHLWEHYLFTNDEQFLLTRAWPLIKGATEFMLDWLIQSPQGVLVTAPSTSPENAYLHPDGYRCSVSIASAMDISIVRNLFNICIKTAKKLNINDDEILKRATWAIHNMASLKIGSDGQIMEWNEDWQEAEPHHRHLSHLFGLYPGTDITMETTPDLTKASKRSLELRGDDGTGWSLAWKINLWARLYDGEHAHKLVSRFFNPVKNTETIKYASCGGLYPNMFAAHPPFQIDANFGYTAGVAEMLVQSHCDNIHLLPALPDVWSAGYVTGLRTRGGFELDIYWQRGLLCRLNLRSLYGNKCRIKYRDIEIVLNTNKGSEYCLNEKLITV
jgi:alpha-L-fucosidase 2